MNVIGNLWSSLFPDLSGDLKNRESERAIDASIRFPLLSLIKSSIVWLILSIVFGLIASIKLHTPSFFAEYSLFTYGKVEPIFWNTLVYGWLFNAGFACAIFLLSRLGGATAGMGLFLTISIVVWNTAVMAGVVGIMAGEQLPYEWLEFPAFVGPVLFTAFVGIGFWCLLTFRNRVHRSSFASQWWIIAALFSFAWIYTAAQVALVCMPAQGAMQTLINSWYAENVFGLFVAPLTFATLLYLLPKTLGAPIVGHKYNTFIAFWTWILFSSFAGASELVFGPVPVWVSSVGVIAMFGLLLPATALSVQFLSSLIRRFSAIWDAATPRFLLGGSIAFVFLMYFKVFGALRDSASVTQFSLYDSGVNCLALFGFAGMVFSGATYFMLPRLLNKELPSPTLVDLHFWSQLMGVILVSIGLISGGEQMGALMNGSTADAIAVVAAMRSSYFMTTIGLVFLLMGAVFSATTYFWLMVSNRTDAEQSADLIKEAPELEYTAS